MIPCDYCAYTKTYRDGRYSPTVSEMRHLSQEEREEYESMLEEHSVSLVPERTCHWVLEHSGTLYDKWRCSECDFLFVEPRCDQGYTDLEPNYCPNCGAKVVEES